jgi:hypothetical protein
MTAADFLSEWFTDEKVKGARHPGARRGLGRPDESWFGVRAHAPLGG